MMNYDEVLNQLYSLTRFGTKLNLANIQCLLDALGNPERKFRSVHVSGSKGKGSVCAFLHSILRAEGFKAGLYTSPHLVEFTERIVVGSEQIPKEKVVSYYLQIKEFVDEIVKVDKTKQVTFFEFTTAIAFKYFADMGVDYAVVEVGLGGRLDATNVILPECAVITNVELEHTNVLGKTIEKIAFEKAGIIKEGIPVVTGTKGKALRIIRNIADLKNSRVVALADANLVKTDKRKFTLAYDNWEIRDVEFALPGTFQFENAALALLCAKNLPSRISERAMREGLKTVIWRGRYEHIHRNPDIIVDCAHTPASARALVDSLAEDYSEVKFVFGVFRDKKKHRILCELSRIGKDIIITQPDSPRAEKPEKLAEIAKKYFRHVEIMEREEAFKKIGSGNGVYCICGSVYLAGDAIAFFENRKYEKVPENAGIDWEKLVDILESVYGNAGHYNEPFRVLVSTILSQRTKDEITYPRAALLFEKFPDVHAIARASPEEIAEVIKPVGFYNTKARTLVKLAQILLNQYGGKVPDNMEALLELPGVGRKTANCVLVFGYGRDALPVDTHVHRISNRLGVVKTLRREETEEALKRIIPRHLWKKINYLFVEHGKAVCRPQKPECKKCQIAGFCQRG